MSFETRPTDCAVLLDVENLTGFLREQGAMRLVEIALEFGSPVVRRAYGNFANPAIQQFVRDVTLAGFELVHVYHPRSGKDSADIQMVVDAMDLVARLPSVGTFLLATGDSDFSPLFRRLRERGLAVVGVGPRSVLADFVKSSCTRYVYTDGPPPRRDSEPVAPGPASNGRSGDSDDALDLALECLRQRGGRVDHAGLKSRILVLDPSFDERRLGFKDFRQFLDSIPGVRTWAEGTVLMAALNGAAPQSISAASSPAPAASLQQYHTALRSLGWRPVDPALVIDCWRVVSMEAVAAPKEVWVEKIEQALGHRATTADIRKSLDVLRKARVLVWSGAEQGRALGRPEVGLQEAEVRRRVDVAILGRLKFSLESRNIPLVRELALPLLATAPDEVVWAELMVAAGENRKNGSAEAVE
ncbi:MAG: NYN domain-containing protein [Deltaproteobacteria bacterium]|nr:NYN domain-containing protein [Deltaproteobacteria bacterium]